MTDVMLEGEAVQAISDLAERAAAKDISKVQANIGGDVLTTVPLIHVPQKPFKTEAEPKPLVFSTLSAVVAYLQQHRDAGLMVLVHGPNQVSVVGPIVGEAKQRFTWVTATCGDMLHGFLDREQRPDEFVVALQTRFVRTPARDALLALVGNMTDQSSIDVMDDGRTQTVSTRAGVHLQGTAQQVPNPVHLSGIRTFREISGQVEAPFLLRVERGPKLTLRSADGGAWAVEAVSLVSAWLRDELSQLQIEVPILA